MKRLTVFVLFVLAISGCVPLSVHPLYRSQDDLTFDEGLLGWWQSEDGPGEKLHIARGDGKLSRRKAMASG